VREPFKIEMDKKKVEDNIRECIEKKVKT